MSDVTAGQGQDGAELSAADEQLLRELTERARTGGLKLTGEGGLLGKLTKMVVEGALEGELDDHLGYGKHDPAGRDGGNSRNGHRAKTVITDTRPSGNHCSAGPEVPVSGAHEPGPDREGPQTLDQPVEGRPQRVRHHLRRPPERGTQVTTEN